MSDATVKWKCKFWSTWNEEAHQQWAEAHARQGLKLSGIACMGLLNRFETAAPEERAIRWDYPPQLTGREHYRQLYRDAGWELVGTAIGWHCWSKAVEPGKPSELFTDSESKRRRYRVVMLPMAVVAAANIPILGVLVSSWPVYVEQGLAGTAAAAIAACAIATASLLYGTLRLWQRIQSS